ncbi:MAG: competence/damage-inducible protein A [Firmicutes bacterium]|nr:competence/damage-inducible protein A [Bacillota bacterium]
MSLRAEIIAIGTELLLGEIVNTNASHIARGLASLGINTYHQQVVGDNPARVKQAFEEAYLHADLVITSGGLGPTEDDLSKEMGAEYFGVSMYLDEKARDHIRNYMTLRGRKIPDNNWKQAYLPEGCIPLYNDNGTAPGFILEKDRKILIMLPGPPSEIVPMFDEQVLPYLRSKSAEVMVSRTLHICGMGESAVEEKLHDEMLIMQNPTLAPYAKEGIVDLRITAKAADEETCSRMIAPVESHIRDIFGNLIFGTDADTLPRVVISLLQERGLHLAVAEAALGGKITDKLVSEKGASRVLKGSLIAYANDAKTGLLGVRPETLEAFGAVSEETAREMARGAASAFSAEIALAETGIAEATDSEKPGGMMCFSVYAFGKTWSKTAYYSRRRNSNREMASSAALGFLREVLIADSFPEKNSF